MRDFSEPRRQGGFNRPPRKTFNDRPSFGGERSERPERDGDRPRRFFGDRPQRRDFSARPERPDFNRPERKFNDRPARFERGDRPERPARAPREERFTKAQTPDGCEQWLSPWVQLKYFSYNPAVFPRMLGAASNDAKPGDLIHVYDKNGELFGTGFWNPASRTPLRVLNHGRDPINENDLKQTLRRAVEWRREQLNLDETTSAYRVLHGDSDGVGGLVVDRYGDVLSLEVSTLGVWQRLDTWLPLLHNLCGTLRHVINVDPSIARMEGIDVNTAPESAPVRTVRVEENGIKYEVDFAQGHKTGFFCDQRDNRKKLATMVKGKTMLDLCCYSGGFSINAKLHGGASEVTAVDLDEKAIAMAKRNANINDGQHRIDFVHADAFVYARQMTRNGKLFDVVLLDPPKFVLGREEEDKMEGIKKYHDLNMLGLQCVRPGGLFVTCSCSGLLSAGEFERVVIKAAQRLGRRLQILETSGPGWDHPYLSTYPEGRYLKVLWARVMPWF